MLRMLARSVIVVATAMLCLASVQDPSRPPIGPTCTLLVLNCSSFHTPFAHPEVAAILTVTTNFAVGTDGECGCYFGACHEAEACASAISVHVTWDPLCPPDNYHGTGNSMQIDRAVYGCGENESVSLLWSGMGAFHANCACSACNGTCQQ